MAFACGEWVQDACSVPASHEPGARPGTVSPFLSLQHSISASLSEAELNAMLFLCQDKIPKRRREAVRSGTELFTILMEQGHVAPDNLQFLRKLLQHIRRDDLLSLVQQFDEERDRCAPADQPDEHEQRLLRVATAVICENVGREWKKLMRKLGMSEVTLDRIEAAHRFNLYEELVQGLREWQKRKGKDAKVADLIKALRDCQLNVVADSVEEEILKVDPGTR